MVPVLRSCQSPIRLWPVNYLHLHLHLQTNHSAADHPVTAVCCLLQISLYDGSDGRSGPITACGSRGGVGQCRGIVSGAVQGTGWRADGGCGNVSTHAGAVHNQPVVSQQAALRWHTPVSRSLGGAKRFGLGCTGAHMPLAPPPPPPPAARRSPVAEEVIGVRRLDLWDGCETVSGLPIVYTTTYGPPEV